MYSQAYDAMTDSRWDRAITGFTRVIELKGTQAGRRPLLEGVLAEPARPARRSAHDHRRAQQEPSRTAPTSSRRRVLEAEVRRDIGQPVRPQDSDRRRREADGAAGAAEQRARSRPSRCSRRCSKAPSSPRLKERALFVLAQSNSPRAREVLRNIAKGGSTPELQSQAIQYLGVHGGPESRAPSSPKSTPRPPTST